MNDLEKLQALEKKLTRGFSLDTACNHLSISLEAAKKWLDAKKELDDFNKIADGIWGRSAAVEAIEELKKIIARTPDDEIRRRACKDLLEFYRDERKRLEAKVEDAKKLASLKIQADLFDTAGNPWTFPTKDS